MTLEIVKIMQQAQNSTEASQVYFFFSSIRSHFYERVKKLRAYTLFPWSKTWQDSLCIIVMRGCFLTSVNVYSEKHIPIVQSSSPGWNKCHTRHSIANHLVHNFLPLHKSQIKIIAVSAHKRTPSLRKTMRLWIFMSLTQYFITQYARSGEKKKLCICFSNFYAKTFLRCFKLSLNQSTRVHKLSALGKRRQKKIVKLHIFNSLHLQ